MKELQVGDPVEVLDPGLMQLYAIAKHFSPETKPNNLGYVSDLDYGGYVLVEFPIGDDPISEHSQNAPYPKHMVRYKEHSMGK